MHSSITAIEVTESTPRAFCEHDDGDWSIQIVDSNGRGIIVYLHGTPSDLADWATKLRRVAVGLKKELP